MKKSISILAIILSFFAVTSNGQDIKAKRINNIHTFLKAILIEDVDINNVITDFMYLTPAPEDQLEKRIRAVQHMIDSVKMDEVTKLNLDNYNVISYNDYSNEKALFSGDTEDILVVDIKGRPAMYFYFNKDKIASFFIIRKGKYGYFLIV